MSDKMLSSEADKAAGKCPACKGNGKVERGGKQVACIACRGSGLASKKDYETKVFVTK